MSTNRELPITPENGGIHELRAKLQRLALFDELLPSELEALASEAEWIGLPGGWVLFEKGGHDDSLFVIIAGRLGVVTEESGNRRTILSYIAPGETVGEMALVSGAPRSATIVAIRDSELVRITKESFDKLARRHLGIMRFITGLLVRRLQQTSYHETQTLCSSIAIVPLTRDVDLDGFAHDLSAELARLKLRTVCIDRTCAAQSTEWFSRIEEANDLVLYQAEYDPSEWTRMSIRQADRVLLLTTAQHPPEQEPPTVGIMQASAPFGDLIEIVFVHDSRQSQTLRIGKLLSRYEARFHHHIRIGRRDDIARLARLVAGQAIGVVFSGGGARGFAHVGVLKAFKSAGVAVDLVGGTSMGSMIAAAAALEWDHEETIEHLTHAFVKTNPLSDYTVPLVAVVRGRKVSRLLQEHFVDTLIEDCWRPFFCTSSDLTSGKTNVHRIGKLWRAIRASIAIPGVLPPVIENNHILIDGGVINNLPVDVMSAMRRGKVVGVDVAREHVLKAQADDDIEQRSLWQLLNARRRGEPSIIGLLMSAGTINSSMQLEQRRQHIDVLIEPQLGNIGMLDWKSWESAVESGYCQTMKVLEHSPLFVA